MAEEEKKTYSFWDRFKSRKFLLALFGVVGAFLTEILDIHIPPETWSVIVTMIITYIGAEGAADVVERYTNAK